MLAEAMENYLGWDVYVHGSPALTFDAPTPHGHTLEQLEREHIVSTLERLHWPVAH